MRTYLTIIIPFLAITVSPCQSFEELGKQYSQKNFEFVIKKGQEFLKSNPDEARVNMLVGRALADQGNYKVAIPYLVKAAEAETKSKWINSWSYGYLGSCYFMNSEFLKAKEALQRCLELDATRNSNKYALGRTLLFGTDSFYDGWTTDSTEHIIFHFQNEDKLDKNTFMTTRQEALQNILTHFPTEFPKKTDFFVWESEQDAMKILKTNLGFSRPEYLITHSRKNQSRGHELAHIVIHHAIMPNSKSRFINEGIATFHDQNNRNRMQFAKEIVSASNQSISVEDLWRNGQNYPESLVYSVGAAWMEYCSETLTNEQLQTILKNQMYDAAIKLLKKELKTTLNAFEEELLED